MVVAYRNNREGQIMNSVAPLSSVEKPGGRPIPDHPDALLFTAEAAFILGLSARTLEALRLRGGGPPFVKVTPKAVRYRRRDLDAWIVARVRSSTRCPAPTDPQS